MKKTSDDTVYENVDIRVCCKHGKPCKKSKQARLYKLGEVLTKPKPTIRPKVEEENTYENLDPNKPKKEVPKEDPKEVEESKKEDSTLDMNPVLPERKDVAKNVYLGPLEWKKAEVLMPNDVAIYHLTIGSNKKPLFMVLKRRNSIRHFRIKQKTYNASETGTSFILEDGSPRPPEFPTLDKLVEYYEDECAKEN